MNKLLKIFWALVFFTVVLNGEDIDKLAAECAAGNQEACKKLADIARNDEYRDFRKAAVEKLTDQALLAKIAIEDEVLMVRAAAVSNSCLTDRAVLSEIAGNTGVVTRDILEFVSRIKLLIQEPRIQLLFPGIRCDVDVSHVGKEYSSSLSSVSGFKLGETVEITLHQAGKPLAVSSWSADLPLITFSLKSEPAKVHGEDLLKQLFRLSDFTPEDLVELLNSNIAEVVIGVTGNLKDQKLLAKLATGAKNSDVRKAAVENLSTDQAVLAKVAIEDRDELICEAAVKKLTDEALLAKVAIEGWDLKVSITAAEKLTDEALLAKVAIEGNEQRVRAAAVNNPNLTDQALLARVMIEDKESWVRGAAAWKLTDQALLTKLAVEAKDWDIRRAAVNKLTDQVLLAKVAIEEKDPLIRSVAVEKLIDQAVLAKVAIEDKESYVRSAAVGELTDQAVLAKLAVEDKDWNVRRAAVKKLTNSAVLADIAKNDKDSDVRIVAGKRLKELQKQ